MSEIIIRIGEPVLTRYERARIVGARALQISHGAPVLIDTDQDDFRPHDVAIKELKARVLPIGLSRRVPNGSPQNIPVHLLKDREFITQINDADLQKSNSSNRSTSKSKKSASTSSSSKYGLTDVDGIGDSTKDDLVEAGFSTVKSLADASVKDLSKVKGIGKKTAEKIISNAQELL